MAVSKQTDESVSIREKREQWEGFELSLLSPFTVLVRNVSHDDPNEHQYVVSVVEGEATSCTCPDARYNHNHCKHQCKVESEPAVLLALGEE